MLIWMITRVMTNRRKQLWRCKVGGSGWWWVHKKRLPHSIHIYIHKTYYLKIFRLALKQMYHSKLSSLICFENISENTFFSYLFHVQCLGTTFTYIMLLDTTSCNVLGREITMPLLDI